MTTEKEILIEFLSYPNSTSIDIFNRFKILPNAIYRRKSDLEEFIFIEGNRKDKILLIAHADTVWDGNIVEKEKELHIINDNIIYNKNGGLGADDRAGCAILWLLKDSGHSLLIVNGEEFGLLGSNYVMKNQDIVNKINEHMFAIQFDRRNSKDFKCYYVGSNEFRTLVSSKTNYSEPNKNSMSDICAIYKEICGVNLSIGYYNEHSINEYLKIDEWYNTYIITKNWLEENHQQYFKKDKESIYNFSNGSKNYKKMIKKYEKETKKELKKSYKLYEGEFYIN